MVITNKKTLEKMKKKNPKSIVVNKDKSITQGGKTYKNKEDYKKNKPAKSKKGIWDWLKGDKFKKKEAEKLSIAKGKTNKAATSKMYAAESMFKTAKARDDAKVTPGKARPFGEAKASAEKADKDRFLWKGKSYFTTRGAADNRDKKKTEIAPKGSIKKKSSLDADTRKAYEKRVAWMKKRKAAGKNFSAKNLAELEAKLK